MKVILHVHPRTGSTSVFQYLRDNPPKHIKEIHHTHYLVNKQHKWFGAGAYNRIRQTSKDAWMVITILRDPVATNLSTFWRWSAKNVMRKGSIFLGEALDYFFQVTDHFSPIHHMSAEVEAFWGFNVYNKPWTTPWTINAGRNLLILKQSDLDKAPQALETFLGVPAKGMPWLNKSKYRLELKFQDAYLRRLYRSRYVTKFWDQDEVNLWIEKYGGKPFKRIHGKQHIQLEGVHKPRKVVRELVLGIQDADRLEELDFDIKAKGRVFRREG